MFQRSAMYSKIPSVHKARISHQIKPKNKYKYFNCDSNGHCSSDRYLDEIVSTKSIHHWYLKLGLHGLVSNKDLYINKTNITYYVKYNSIFCKSWTSSPFFFLPICQYLLHPGSSKPFKNQKLSSLRCKAQQHYKISN